MTRLLCHHFDSIIIVTLSASSELGTLPVKPNG